MMRPGMRDAAWQWRAMHGFTLFECGVAGALLAVFGGLLLQRMDWYAQEAEQVAALRMQADLRTVLYMKAAGLHAAGRDAELAALAGQNPITWLPEVPRNYRGEYFAPKAGQVAPGNWYFDRAGKNLVYLFDDSNRFAKGNPGMICFKVESLSLPSPPARPAPKDGVALIQVFDDGCRNRQGSVIL
ncbi:hypothetical protein AAKU55_001649 [Oxalobacteraceae bacterium GrIS 1.11]